MRCQVVSLQEKPWCTSFRRQVNKHSEEEAKFIWLTFGICKVGLKFLEYETFESWTLCHLQEFARGALKQCREIRASSLPFLSTPSSRSAAALADPLWGRAWSRPLSWSLADRRGTSTAGWQTAMTQTTRWFVSFLTNAKNGYKAAVAGVECQTMLELASCWHWPCLWTLPWEATSWFVEDNETVKVKQGYGQGQKKL